jgi:hypothetical protein
MQYIGQISPDLAVVGVKRGKVLLRISGFFDRAGRDARQKKLET